MNRGLMKLPILDRNNGGILCLYLYIVGVQMPLMAKVTRRPALCGTAQHFHPLSHVKHIFYCYFNI